MSKDCSGWSIGEMWKMLCSMLALSETIFGNSKSDDKSKMSRGA
jgi:hypothetical protein